jgi:hypothetical protein
MEIAVLKRTVEQLSHNYSEAHSTLLVKSLLRILGGRRREGGRDRGRERKMGGEGER